MQNNNASTFHKSIRFVPKEQNNHHYTIDCWIKGNLSSLEDLEYASRCIEKRKREIHYQFVKKHLDSIMKGKQYGTYEELGENIILEDGTKLTRNDIEKYAKINGFKLRTENDRITDLLYECADYLSQQPRF